MKKYGLLIIGIIGLIASFVWMVLSHSSVGGFLIVACISGAVLGKGIGDIKGKNKRRNP